MAVGGSLIQQLYRDDDGRDYSYKKPPTLEITGYIVLEDGSPAYYGDASNITSEQARQYEAQGYLVFRGWVIAEDEATAWTEATEAFGNRRVSISCWCKSKSRKGRMSLGEQSVPWPVAVVIKRGEVGETRSGWYALDPDQLNGTDSVEESIDQDE